MKQFHFTLEAVLRLRAEEFEKVRHAFAECAQWRARAMGLVSVAQAEVDACHAAITEKRERRTTRNDQLLFLNALQYQHALLQRHKEELSRVERELDARRHAMLAAQRKVEALERLKEHKLQAHRAEMRRREAAMIDDLIGARFAMRMTEVAA